MSNKTLISKISLKTIGAQPRAADLLDDQKQPLSGVLDLAVIFGRVHKVDIATSTFGESERFHGRFEAINARTGEVFEGRKAFLPAVVAPLLADAIRNAENGASVDFALKIGAKYANGDRGYEYVIVPIRQVQESDELGELRAQAASALPALTHEKADAEKPEKPSKKK